MDHGQPVVFQVLLRVCWMKSERGENLGAGGFVINNKAVHCIMADETGIMETGQQGGINLIRLAGLCSGSSRGDRCCGLDDDFGEEW